MGKSIKMPKKIVLPIDVSNAVVIIKEAISLLNWFMAENRGRSNEFYPYELCGYLDDDLKVGVKIDGLPILGRFEDARSMDNYLFLLAGCANRAEPDKAERIFNQIGLPHARYESIIHPNAYLSDGVEIGQGCIICQGAQIMPKACIKPHVIVYPNAVVSAGAIIGPFTTIQAGVYIGECALVYKSAFIGANACIGDKVVVGNNSVVNMGAVVPKSLAAGVVVVGNPAKPLLATGRLRKLNMKLMER
jgi:sugar O-acyltransferase (sialic acid O-acetyltransferase NeuD family)